MLEDKAKNRQELQLKTEVWQKYWTAKENEFKQVILFKN